MRLDSLGKGEGLACLSAFVKVTLLDSSEALDDVEEEDPRKEESTCEPEAECGEVLSALERLKGEPGFG